MIKVHFGRPMNSGERKQTKQQTTKCLYCFNTILYYNHDNIIIYIMANGCTLG